jgi:hypothetical protein
MAKAHTSTRARGAGKTAKSSTEPVAKSLVAVELAARLARALASGRVCIRKVVIWQGGRVSKPSSAQHQNAAGVG